MMPREMERNTYCKYWGSVLIAREIITLGLAIEKTQLV